MPATRCTSWSIKLSKFECRGSGLGDHCYKIVDNSSSELSFGVGAYEATRVKQFAFARPFNYGHRFRKRKGGTQPCGFMSAFSVANWIPVSPKPPSKAILMDLSTICVSSTGRLMLRDLKHNAFKSGVCCFSVIAISNAISRQGAACFDPVHAENRAIHYHVVVNTNSKRFISTAIYARAQNRDKDAFWHHLKQLNESINPPWCIIGDFNELLQLSDKVGGATMTIARTQRLNDFLDHTRGIDAHVQGRSQHIHLGGALILNISIHGHSIRKRIM
ncbi:hypothetical protein Cgig2_021440 [Carnegiea gigantea]|uniref:Endonuclease/exonuclease/phosphatase domain-containing protein n=1 Tax=Carnegiea gigantea TaxID=171969 RepID=A0A9Q1K428_9CARY|nr:hypothetical protein Cgig2_021440 [Carnegiea gigantea]